MKSPVFSITLPCGLEISDSLKESEVAAREGVERADMGTGYVWVALPAQNFGENTVSFSLSFYHDQLESIRMSVQDPQKYGAGWSEYSEEKERLCATETGKWIEALGYVPGEYSWGSVWVGYESKTPFGGAVIRYKIKQTQRGKAKR